MRPLLLATLALSLFATATLCAPHSALAADKPLPTAWIKVPKLESLPDIRSFTDPAEAVKYIEACYEAKWPERCKWALERQKEQGDFWRYRPDKYDFARYRILSIKKLTRKTATEGLSTVWRKPGNIEITVEDQACLKNACRSYVNTMVYDLNKEANQFRFIGFFDWSPPD